MFEFIYAFAIIFTNTKSNFKLVWAEKRVQKAAHYMSSLFVPSMS